MNKQELTQAVDETASAVNTCRENIKRYEEACKQNEARVDELARKLAEAKVNETLASVRIERNKDIIAEQQASVDKFCAMIKDAIAAEDFDQAAKHKLCREEVKVGVDTLRSSLDTTVDNLKTYQLRAKEAQQEMDDFKEILDMDKEGAECLPHDELALAERAHQEAKEALERFVEKESASASSDDGEYDDGEYDDDDDEYDEYDDATDATDDDVDIETFVESILDMCERDDSPVPRAYMHRRGEVANRRCFVCDKSRKPNTEMFVCCRNTDRFRTMLNALMRGVSCEQYNDKVAAAIYANDEQIELAAHDMEMARPTFGEARAENECPACGHGLTRVHKSIGECSIMQVVATLYRALYGIEPIVYTNDTKRAARLEFRLRQTKVVGGDVEPTTPKNTKELVVVDSTPANRGRIRSASDCEVTRLESEAEIVLDQQNDANMSSAAFMVFDEGSELAEYVLTLHKSGSGVDYRKEMVSFMGIADKLLRAIKSDVSMSTRISAALQAAHCVFRSEAVESDDDDDDADEIVGDAALSADEVEQLLTDVEQLRRDVADSTTLIANLRQEMQSQQRDARRQHDEMMAIVKSIAERLPHATPARAFGSGSPMKRKFNALFDSSIPTTAIDPTMLLDRPWTDETESTNLSHQ